MKIMTLKAIIPALLAVCLGLAPDAFAESEPGYSGDLKDAWLHGKVETAFALNRHLNPFRIDTDVRGGIVTLSGAVESDIDRDLAGQIALSVEGVMDVQNELKVAEGTEVAAATKSKMSPATDTFAQKVSDATTTAVVKTKLLANNNTKGLEVNVDTHNNIVTLRGTVESDEVRDLAGALAQNTERVERVDNQLEIMKKS